MIPLGFGGSQPRRLKELTVRLFRRLVGVPRVGCSATRLVSVRGKAASFVCLSVGFFVLVLCEVLGRMMCLGV